MRARPFGALAADAVAHPLERAVGDRAEQIAELQLRVELERVARLEREHELELQRRERLAAQVAETSAAR